MHAPFYVNVLCFTFLFLNTASFCFPFARSSNPSRTQQKLCFVTLLRMVQVVEQNCHTAEAKLPFSKMLKY